jgi:endonuclease YncB( thermonuclease family)
MTAFHMTPVLRTAFIAAITAMLHGHPLAANFSGRVVLVPDGDTITVLVERHEIKVRLAEIDAPESKQAFGTHSKQALSDLCFRKDARLETQGKDRYGRTIATVYCAGRHANAEQVWQGMAWVSDIRFRNSACISPSSSHSVDFFIERQ